MGAMGDGASDFGEDLQSMIVRAVRRRLNGLHRTWPETIRNVNNALDELTKLGIGEMPDYGDEWLVPFYVSWYQYGHAHLASAIFRHLFEKNTDLSRPEPLHVIDLGCGALAAQIGFAAFMRQKPEAVRNIPEIVFHNIDTSEAMKDIGRELWDGLGCADIRPFYHKSAADLDKVPMTRSILIVMHAIYRENRHEMDESVDRIRRDHRPSVSVMTTNRHTGYPITEMKPAQEIRISHGGPIKPDKVTECRKKIMETLIKKANEYNVEYIGAIRNLLGNDVPGWPNDPSVFQLR